MTDTYHMTDEWQVYSALIIPVVQIGIWALVGMAIRGIRKRDEIEAIDLERTIHRQSIHALAAGLFMGRDQHIHDDREKLRRCRG